MLRKRNVSKSHKVTRPLPLTLACSLAQNVSDIVTSFATQLLNKSITAVIPIAIISHDYLCFIVYSVFHPFVVDFSCVYSSNLLHVPDSRPRYLLPGLVLTTYGAFSEQALPTSGWKTECHPCYSHSMMVKISVILGRHVEGLW